ADGEGGVSEVGGLEFAGARAVGDGAALCRNFGQARDVSIRNNGGDDTVVDRDGDGHVDVGVQADAVGGPAGVEARMLEQPARDQRYQKIGMCNTDVIRALNSGDDLVAVLVERGSVNVAADEEMRDGGPAPGGAFGHDAAEGGRDLDATGGLRLNCAAARYFWAVWTAGD